MTKACRLATLKMAAPVRPNKTQIIKRLEREAHVACMKYDPKKPETLEACIIKSNEWAKAGGVQDDSY